MWYLIVLIPDLSTLTYFGYVGLQHHTEQWIDCFLSGRSQKVVVQDASSAVSPVTSGVPQGTVIGPCFFPPYINDIGDNISSTVRLFTYDCVIPSNQFYT